MQLVHLYISPGHNYFGRHGQPPGDYPMIEVEKMPCIARCGILRDRFYRYEENYKGQITFFSDEVYQSLCEEFDVWDRPPSVFRRNVVIRGADLPSLTGQTFQVQGVQFFGVEECKPCYWMDQALCPGTERALQGRGGLRARILTSGILRVLRKTKTVDDLFRSYTAPSLATV